MGQYISEEDLININNSLIRSFNKIDLYYTYTILSNKYNNFIINTKSVINNIFFYE